MRHNIIGEARKVAGEVRATENDYDVALAGNARLIADLLDVRRNNQLPASVGQVAVDQAIKAMTHAAKARTSLLAMHQELARLNLRELAVGDLTECPEKWRAELSIVGNDHTQNAA